MQMNTVTWNRKCPPICELAHQHWESMVHNHSQTILRIIMTASTIKSTWDWQTNMQPSSAWKSLTPISILSVKEATHTCRWGCRVWHPCTGTSHQPLMVTKTHSMLFQFNRGSCIRSQGRLITTRTSLQGRCKLASERRRKATTQSTRVVRHPLEWVIDKTRIRPWVKRTWMLTSIKWMVIKYNSSSSSNNKTR